MSQWQEGRRESEPGGGLSPSRPRPLAWPRPRPRPTEAVLHRVSAPTQGVGLQGFGRNLHQCVELGLLWQRLTTLQMQKSSVLAGPQPSSNPTDKFRLVGHDLWSRLSFATLFIKAKG